MFRGKHLPHLYGIYSELFVVLYLKVHGYTILRRRYRTYVGEVDVLALRGDELVAIEVKGRFSGAEDALDAVTVRQMRRISNATSIFLSSCDLGLKVKKVRFDVVCFKGLKMARYVRNAW